MTTFETADALDLLDFWLSAGPEAWFTRAAAFDERCRQWLPLWEHAREGGCEGWAQTAAGSLALIILLDQIPRNCLRGRVEQFSTDHLALAQADRACALGHDRAYAMPAKNFFYMPYQHAEDLAAQERGLDRYRAAGVETFYFHALAHADAIRRFGRFPHRNRLLGRTTTKAEQRYMATGGIDPL